MKITEIYKQAFLKDLLKDHYLGSKDIFDWTDRDWAILGDLTRHQAKIKRGEYE